MANFFTVDVLTPSQVLAKDWPAESLLLPTSQGQINLLAEHTHIIVRLETGLLSIFGGPNDSDEHFSITTGVGKVLGRKVLILANVAEKAQEIDVERAQRALDHAVRTLEGKEQQLSFQESTKYHRKVERAKLRLHIAKLVNKGGTNNGA